MANSFADAVIYDLRKSTHVSEHLLNLVRETIEKNLPDLRCSYCAAMVPSESERPKPSAITYAEQGTVIPHREIDQKRNQPDEYTGPGWGLE